MKKLFLVFVSMTIGLLAILSCFREVDQKGIVIPLPEEMEIECR